MSLSHLARPFVSKLSLHLPLIPIDRCFVVVLRRQEDFLGFHPSKSWLPPLSILPGHVFLFSQWKLGEPQLALNPISFRLPVALVGRAVAVTFKRTINHILLQLLHAKLLVLSVDTVHLFVLIHKALIITELADQPTSLLLQLKRFRSEVGVKFPWVALPWHKVLLC